ncbi:hypothetical protein M405DRAFT_824322 [Rhizopogon salebrosus TDB-379]|nr:hypothetical protein M405DRAFT_824322 [Rhizopogon salebrosus TDB-379]
MRIINVIISFYAAAAPSYSPPSQRLRFSAKKASTPFTRPFSLTTSSVAPTHCHQAGKYQGQTTQLFM